MNIINQLLEKINKQLRLSFRAGEVHGTWGVSGIPQDNWLYVHELEAVTGSPILERRITPELSVRDTEIFLRGAVLALDKEDDGIWK